MACIANYPVVVQFKRVEDFLADLRDGRPVAVYHDLIDRPGFNKCMASVIRAVVVNGDVAHVATLTFQYDLVWAEVGKPADAKTQLRHFNKEHDYLMAYMGPRLVGIGVGGAIIRRGVVDLPAPYVLVYAQPIPEEERPSKESREDHE